MPPCGERKKEGETEGREGGRERERKKMKQRGGEGGGETERGGGGKRKQQQHTPLLLVVFMNPLNILHRHVKEVVRNFNRWAREDSIQMKNHPLPITRLLKIV